MFSWLENSLPGLFCMINLTAQENSDTMCDEKVSEFYKAIWKDKDASLQFITNAPVGHESLIIKVHAYVTDSQ